MARVIELRENPQFEPALGNGAGERVRLFDTGAPTELSAVGAPASKKAASWLRIATRRSRFSSGSEASSGTSAVNDVSRPPRNSLSSSRVSVVVR
ncbi:hypothetical protein P9209_16325 [Prescottella defluvii]|nr:hypothetical protein P9209_16325 [Prescottella defluvii]